MRNYLYIWHDAHEQFIVASGIEFKDFVPTLRGVGGVLLIDGKSDTANYDVRSGFPIVMQSGLPLLAREDIYSWGNYVWVDFSEASCPNIADSEIAELLFFGHRGRPLRAHDFPSLRNRFMASIHDDGWYLKLYYSRWEDMQEFLEGSIPLELGSLDIHELRQGVSAYWLKNGVVQSEDRTHDVDSVLNRHN